MDTKIINLGSGDGRGVDREPVDLRAGHFERSHLAVNGFDGSRWVSPKCRGHQVPVEEEMRVLIGSHSLEYHRPGFVQETTSVPVGDPRGQLLKGQVDEAVSQTLVPVAGTEPCRDLPHAGSFEP